MKSVAVTGVTLSGNMGGAAMLAAVLENLAKLESPPQVNLLSISPRQDKYFEDRLTGQVSIINSHYVLLLLVYLPLCVALYPVLRLSAVRWLLRRIPYFAALQDATVVIDLAGIAFVDGRGLPLLIYNVACCLPASLMGKPVVKMAQALGPFNTVLNRLIAKFVLRRCDTVIARGKVTSGFLDSLGISHERKADVAFAMTVSPDDHAVAASRMAAFRSNGKKLLILSPSEVARRLAEAANIEFIAEFSRLIIDLSREGYSIVLLPHSYGRGSSKNNDLDLARKIHSSLPLGVAGIVDDVEDPKLLRALIGEADFFIGCRFHSVVASLSMAVPTVIVGWSHKYAEMAEPFITDRFVVPIEQFSADALKVRLAELTTDPDKYRTRLRQAAEAARSDAEANFIRVRQLLGVTVEGKSC
jgi:colanic acid/amylovoran biosynthesis protein